MSRTFTVASLIALAALPFFGPGCVPQDRYDSVSKTHKALKEQLVRTEEERDSALANLGTLRSQLSDATRDLIDMRNKNAQLNGEIDTLAANYDALMVRVAELQLSPLDPVLQSDLAQLAAEYPDLISFDARTGMLRLASDFTFDLGSTELKPGVAETIRRLALILNGDKARGYEIRVIGHTDNVRIGKPDTRQRHPTNVHLSAHRAIAVRDVIVQAGVEPVRIQVAGYGEFRPVVANGAQGAAANRRVELFLLPMPASVTYGSSEAPPDTTSRPTTPRQPVTEPMK